MRLKLRIMNHSVMIFADHAIKNLFSREKDPIKIIQFKEIYEELEEVADSCQSVANVLETIIMKNA